MKKIVNLMVVIIMFIVVGGNVFASDNKLVIHFGEQKKELIYNADYIIRNDQLLVQAHSITPALPFVVPGKGIWWDDQKKEITFADIDKDGYMIDRLSIKPGENEIRDYNKIIKINSQAILLNGRVFLPLRAISEAYDNRVHWKNENGQREVYITPIANNENISTDVELYDSEGNEITVYEMDEEEYKKTDFRTKEKMIK